MSFRHIQRMNREVLALDDHHPAKQFLIEFMRCRRRCVGLEIPWRDYVPVDQAWKSATDGRNWQFSGFAYCFLSFDIELDGFNNKSATFTESELTWFKNIL